MLVVTDGEDNTSHNSLEKTIREIQKTDTVIYTIGLLSEESKKNAKRAKRALEDIAKASGGLAFFPENVADVKDICENVAHDIRNQYTLAYYPTNTKRDGTFRTVQVDVTHPAVAASSQRALATATTPQAVRGRHLRQLTGPRSQCTVTSPCSRGLRDRGV